MMKNEKNLLGSWLILIILSSCTHYEPPKSELCIFGDQGGICVDDRLPEDRREYVLPFPDMINYICTNPSDWNEQKDWWLEKLEKLEKCERGLKDEKRTGIDHFK